MLLLFYDTTFNRYTLLTCTSKKDVCIACHRLSSYDRRAFCVAGPSVWNSLPVSVRDPVIGGNNFRPSLKTFLFATYWCIQRIRGFTTMHYINRLFYLLTYLLTYLLLSSLKQVLAPGSSQVKSDKKLSYWCREVVQCFVSLNITLSLKVIQNTPLSGICVEQFTKGSAVFWVTGHFSTPP